MTLIKWKSSIKSKMVLAQHKRLAHVRSMSNTFISIEAAEQIQPGDMIKVVRGRVAGNNEIVKSVSRSSNTFSPICGWYGGESLRFHTVDGAVVNHFMLCPEAPVTEKAWLNAGELAAL